MWLCWCRYVEWQCGVVLEDTGGGEGGEGRGGLGGQTGHAQMQRCSVLRCHGHGGAVRCKGGWGVRVALYSETGGLGFANATATTDATFVFLPAKIGQHQSQLPFCWTCGYAFLGI